MSRLASRFQKVFTGNMWGDAQSASGVGSRLDSHSVLAAVSALDEVIRRFQIASIVDLPCGDFNWFPLVIGRYPYIKYYGLDIVAPLVASNRVKYPHYEFRVLDITREIPPKAEMIFCKDLVNHLTEDDVAKLLRNMKLSGSRYMMITSNKGWQNSPLPSSEPGASRHLDLLTPPYSLPTPVWETDYLAMWALDAIPLSFFDRLCTELR